jgi:hypothetical protein
MASEGMSSPDSGGAARRRERTIDGNFSFGRVGGSDVRLHWSLLAVLILIVWSLAEGSSRHRTRVCPTGPTSRWRS